MFTFSCNFEYLNLILKLFVRFDPHDAEAEEELKKNISQEIKLTAMTVVFRNNSLAGVDPS